MNRWQDRTPGSAPGHALSDDETTSGAPYYIRFLKCRTENPAASFSEFKTAAVDTDNGAARRRSPRQICGRYCTVPGQTIRRPIDR